MALMACYKDTPYIIHKGTLYTVDPTDGSWASFDEDWEGAEAMTSHQNGFLYIVHNGTLYWFNPDNGEWQEMAQEWEGVEAITVGANDYLYALHDGVLY